MKTEFGASQTASLQKQEEAVGGLAAAASPELTGGAGFTYEDSVTALYAVALLSETTAPGLPGRLIKRLSVQQGSLGHPLDDVIVEGESLDGVRVRLSLQVKRKLVISSAQSNTDFRETVLRAYSTIVGSAFTIGQDRVGAVTGEIADGSKRNFETLCEWARVDSDVAGFVKKLRTDGFAGEKEAQFDGVRSILSSKLPEAELDAATHLLLSHFVLMRFEMLHEGSVTEAQTVASLANYLHPTDRARADDLWRRLLALVRISEGQAAAFDRKTLVARLNGAFRLTGAPSMQAALSQVAAEARLAVAEIGNDIAGVCIPRGRFIQAARRALIQHRFVQIGGLPGAGKSVVLRSLVEEALVSGPALFLKADRLAGATWSQHATASGLGSTPLEELLVELGATGAYTVFVDGLDRVEVRHRGVLLDIFNTILNSPHLQSWRVMATVRDTGIEPLRTWLPNKLLDNGALVIDVNEFDDIEATLLAKEKPALAPLLFGSEQVRAIVRRPFFAGVLIKRHVAETSVPSSEVELATTWWAGGGYGADAARAGHRRNALVALAQAGAATLGRRILTIEIDPQALAELEADGVVRYVRIGQTVCFVHDIYFEWSFLQLLVSRGKEWLEAIRQVGEPPVLGRVVELLSQSEILDGQDWQKYLELLEATTDVRSQWLRAWMIGPLGLPSFQMYDSIYNTAMLADGAGRVAKLAVWFQAEKTKANPMMLDGKAFPDLELTQRLRFADSLAWPSDMDTWRRCCDWLLQWIDDIPTAIWPDVLAVFEVWQNAFTDFANPVSERIVGLATSWLMDIEARFHGRIFPKDRGGWEQLKRDESEDMEKRLRAMLLRAGRAYTTSAREYLSNLQTMEHMPRAAFDQVLDYAPILSEVCPIQLVDFALKAMIQPLPAEVAKRSSGSAFGHGIHSHDWQSLSIDEHHEFFPCAPTREPFPSLFSHAPEEARRLVRQLANHAITAWRQLHRLDYDHRGTPIPLALGFPWGRQTFWGGAQQYLWSRGTWGSHVVGSGLMALEAWAFKEVEKGRLIDDVLRDVLAGHESVAALEVAAAIALESKHCSETTLPLLTSQRIWGWDIKRSVSDMSHSGNLIGFQPKDRRHFDAAVEGNQRPGRRLDMRWLASVCVLSGGDLGVKASELITKFADDLPFDYAEERTNSGTIQHLRRTAEIWAEVGKSANYRATPAEDGSGVVIHMENPKAQGPDIDAINRRQAEMAEHLPLLNWVNDSFEKNGLGGGLSLDQAMERAKRLDTPALFEGAHDHVSASHQRQAAVAGVAAVALHLGEGLPPADLDWAADVCLRAWMTPEAPSNHFFSSSILLFHPVLYTVHGLAALVRHDPVRRAALEALLQLAAHPYDQIVTGALGSLLKLWDRRPDIAWLALGLAVSLSIVERPPFDATPDQREEQERRRIEILVETALTRIEISDKSPQPLPSMPPAWVAASKGQRYGRSRHGRSAMIDWEHPATDLHWQLLAKVLTCIPVPTAMVDESRRDLFLSWCDDLVGWTIERLYPTWSRQPGPNPFEVEASELYEWRRELYRFLARVSSHLDPHESARRFIEPAVSTDDETFGSLLESYVSFLTCNIMDEPVLPNASLTLLKLIIPRLLSHGGWRRSEWNDGALNDAELSHMIRSIFFVDVEKALGAARFANGNWNDVSSILPLVEPVLAAQGRNPAVVSAFLTLCERAFASYPTDRFVAQLSTVLGQTEGTPLGWRGTSLPARLAGLIQRFSEKTLPMPAAMARSFLSALDALVDMGDRRAAAIQTSEAFKEVRITGSPN